MTEISNITASANTEINNNSDKKQEIKPNDTSLKNDKVEISSMSKKKKIALGFVAVNLIATAASLAYAIGRNPAKAAKVLKGHSNITNEAYTQGNKLAEEIMNKQGEFKTSFNDILAILVLSIVLYSPLSVSIVTVTLSKSFKTPVNSLTFSIGLYSFMSTNFPIDLLKSFSFFNGLVRPGELTSKMYCSLI